ncbi:MAG: hypothetical protein RJB38_1943 [Pseudomonadota bacterium]|jgi:two-component system chemotaxis sensor kinase CheA
MDSFELELKQGFIQEAEQLLSDAEQCFLLLESNPQDQPTLEKIFRIAHNIKGSAKAVGFDELGAFTHEFESFMLKCKSGEIPILPQTISILLLCNDHVKEYVTKLKEDPSAHVDSRAVIAKILNFSLTDTAAGPTSDEGAFEGTELPDGSMGFDEDEAIEDQEGEDHSVASPMGSVLAEAPASDSTVPFASTAALASSPPPRDGAPSSPTGSNHGQGASSASDETIRVSLGRLDRLINFVGEMVILQTVLKELAQSENPAGLKKTVHQMGKVTKEVQDLSMGLRMVPVKQTFLKMQRIVRDTSTLLGKRIQLSIQGEETELDKTVLESLGDPLTHLVRNAVDHGIETPEERRKAGKPELGQIVLRACHEGGKLVIEVKDDGGGISADRLRKKALEKGILKPGQNITDEEAIKLIFHPGFSTKAQVTEVSGRGVGMDVVKTNIEQMQGEVLVDTSVGSGSTFKVILPLTLAIIDGIVVTCAENRYVIPLAHVHETLKPEPKDIKFATGVGEVLLLRGENLPVMRLSRALGKAPRKDAGAEQIAIIIRTTETPFATLVDDIIGQHQVVIKKLGSELQHLAGYSGSAILGDGRPAMILELGDLVVNHPALKSNNPTKRQAVA